MKNIYCPKCGNEMKNKNNELICESGKMHLSKIIEKELLRRFIYECYPISEKIHEKGHKWYCPGCGVPLKKDLSCNLCSKSIADLKYQLVEFHPHE
ncbi:MAG: hypothetical protein GY714_16120 [Desulfobacterales bacterium]|nr:hypothetical protein [Desulfobacterales bacterium]